MLYINILLLNKTRLKPVTSDCYTVIFVDQPNPNHLDFTAEAHWLHMTKATVNVQKITLLQI